jgi:hypothetical protein
MRKGLASDATRVGREPGQPQPVGLPATYALGAGRAVPLTLPTQRARAAEMQMTGFLDN